MMLAYPIAVKKSTVEDLLLPKTRLQQKRLIKRSLLALFALYMVRRYVRSGHLDRSTQLLSLQNHTYIKSDVDGCWINFNSWDVDNPRAVVVLAHMYGSSSKNFDGLARFFNARSIDVHGIDFRGHGDSDRPCGFFDFGPSLETSAADFVTFLQFLHEKYQKEAASNGKPMPKIFLLGEGTGALVAILALQKIQIANVYKSQGRLAFSFGAPPAHGNQVLDLAQRISGLILINPTIEFGPLATVQKSLVLRNLHNVASKFLPFLRTLPLPLWIKLFCGSFGSTDRSFFEQLSILDSKERNAFTRVMNLRTQQAVIAATNKINNIMEYNANEEYFLNSNDKQLHTLFNILNNKKADSIWNPYSYYYSSTRSKLDYYLETSRLPLLVLHATRDTLCTDESVKRFFRFWKSTDKAMLHVSDVGHGFLHNTSPYVLCQATHAVREWLCLHSSVEGEKAKPSKLSEQKEVQRDSSSPTVTPPEGTELSVSKDSLRSVMKGLNNGTNPEMSRQNTSATSAVLFVD